MDKIFEAIIESALAELPPADRAKMKTLFNGKIKAQNDPFSVTVDVIREAEKSAKLAKALYDAYTKEGFSPEQAFDLTKNIVAPKGK